MLYKLSSANGKFSAIRAEPFRDFSAFGNLEKDLENLIANNMLEVLFEEAGLLPVFQQRQWQEEADIYALNEHGDLFIFELKRGIASEDAVHQALRYTQRAGQWTLSDLQDKFHLYEGLDTDILLAHQEAFQLEHPLTPGELNRKQHLFIIGSASDDDLVSAIGYWKQQGISIDFLPYRIYEIDNKQYFELFSPPFDRHINPGDQKGVIFDTNRSWDEDAIWDMMDNNRVAAFGNAKRFVEHIYPGDTVFFSHRGFGIVAAARVKQGVLKAPDEDSHYRDVEFLTTVPKKGETLKAMPFGEVVSITGKSFFWARTIKVPYLNARETAKLLKKLKALLE